MDYPNVPYLDRDDDAALRHVIASAMLRVNRNPEYVGWSDADRLAAYEAEAMAGLAGAWSPEPLDAGGLAGLDGFSFGKLFKKLKKPFTVIAAGAATYFTGGAAAPLLAKALASKKRRAQGLPDFNPGASFDPTGSPQADALYAQQLQAQQAATRSKFIIGGLAAVVVVGGLVAIVRSARHAA